MTRPSDHDPKRRPRARRKTPETPLPSAPSGEEKPSLASADCRRRASATAQFGAFVRAAIDDPRTAAKFSVAYASLSPVERRALRAAVAEEGLGGDEVGLLLACLDAIETDAFVRPRWQAWQGDGRLAVGAPEVGMLEVRRGEVRVVPQCGPEQGDQPANLEETVDELAELLWRARRSGTPWPDGASRFAALFDRAAYG